MKTASRVSRFSRFSMAFGILAPLATLFACSGDFDPVSRITDLRVLAVHADHTYAKPGDTVHLDTLWFAPKKDTRGRSWVWARCVDPDSTSVVGCFQAIAKELRDNPIDPSTLDPSKPPPGPFLNFFIPGTVTGGRDLDTMDVTVPTDALSRLNENARINATVGVITIVCPGAVTLVDPNTLGPTDLPIKCLEDGTNRDLPLDEWVIGIKRIFVRQTDQNANPVFSRVKWDNEEWKEGDVKEVTACDTDGNRFDRCDDSLAHEVAIELTPESFESGTDEAGSSFTEQLVAQYYATQGLFENEVRIARNSATKFVARTVDVKDGGNLITLWLVARDNRGGVSWVTRQVRVK